MFSGLFGGQSSTAAAGGTGAGQPGERTSLLADWNAYSNGRDIEAGGPSSVTAAGAGARMESALRGAGTFLQSSFNTVSQSVASGVSAIPGQLPTTESFSVPSAQQLSLFFALLAGGGALLVMAFLLFLPVIYLLPAKFALSFTFGCLLIFAGFTQLRGWRQQLEHMLSGERLPFTAVYGGSILATLYAALFMHSYVLSLVCSALQVVALLYYLMSYFPGGTQGVKFMLNLFAQAALSCFASVQRMVLK